MAKAGEGCTVKELSSDNNGNVAIMARIIR
jgi:hypothetical protein